MSTDEPTPPLAHSVRKIPDVPVFNCHVYLSTPDATGLITARAASLPELVATGRNEREALRNIVKHADVSQAVLRCHNVGDHVEITVRDHGTGFDPATTTKGFGTTSSIAARLEECGGGAQITSQLGRGTRVRLWAPR